MILSMVEREGWEELQEIMRSKLSLFLHSFLTFEQCFAKVKRLSIVIPKILADLTNGIFVLFIFIGVFGILVQLLFDGREMCSMWHLFRFRSCPERFVH